MRLTHASVHTLCSIMVCGTVHAQSAQAPQTRPQSPSPRPATAIAVETAAELTNGWALLTDGKAAQAAERAARVLAADPRSTAGLILAVEADLARAGVATALMQYERWLGARTLEEPGVVRRIAVAALREEAAQQQDSAVRLEALRSLAAAGDAAADTELSRALSAGSGVEARMLATMGNQRAVAVLLADLQKGIANTVLTVDALGESGSRQAMAPLLGLLADSRIEVRGAAVNALGKFGDRSLVSRLKPLLSDQSGFVRVRAAGALYRLGDDSGLQLLQDLMADPSASMRLAAADAMASRPDTGWLALVRDLTRVREGEVRAAAARLIAAHDPDLARTVLESLTSDENPAIRDLASQWIADVPTDLTGLRRLMRASNRMTRVRAAGRVLALTR
jgi:hypothetical protein